MVLCQVFGIFSANWRYPIKDPWNVELPRFYYSMKSGIPTIEIWTPHDTNLIYRVIETLMLTCFYIFECSISVRGASYNLQSQNLLYTSVPLYSYSKPLWIHVLVEGNWYTKTWRQFQLKSERGRWQQDVDNAGQKEHLRWVESGSLDIFFSMNGKRCSLSKPTFCMNING